MRARCIQESSTSPSVKKMMLHAFEAGTDTEDMWGLLQMHCLRLPKDTQAEAAQLPFPAPPPEEFEPASVSPPLRRIAPPPLQPPTSTREPAEKPAPAHEEPAREAKTETFPTYHYLTLRNKRYRIALPTDGEIVIGRFDPASTTNPDIDLSYNDRKNRVISRRHTRIVGLNSRFAIEDLGSTNGTMVNGKKLEIGEQAQLRPGDWVTLGYHEFSYIRVPETQISEDTLRSAYLWSTFTGHRFPLPLQGEAIIGRRDPLEDVVPDIDLSGEQEAAQVITRRHAIIIARDGRHYVTDLGSAYGVKLNGLRIRIGQLGILGPGDHIWLGGCVLAYDIER